MQLILHIQVNIPNVDFATGNIVHLSFDLVFFKSQFRNGDGREVFVDGLLSRVGDPIKPTLSECCAKCSHLHTTN